MKLFLREGFIALMLERVCGNWYQRLNFTLWWYTGKIMVPITNVSYILIWNLPKDWKESYQDNFANAFIFDFHNNRIFRILKSSKNSHQKNCLKTPTFDFYNRIIKLFQRNSHGSDLILLSPSHCPFSFFILALGRNF